MGIEVAPIVKQNDSVTADSPRLAYFNSFFFFSSKEANYFLKKYPQDLNPLFCDLLIHNEFTFSQQFPGFDFCLKKGCK